MRFACEHELDGEPALVAGLLASPGFHTTLRLPDVALPSVLDQRQEDGSAVLTLRYVFTGRLDPLAHRLLGGGELAWIQELRVADEASGGSLRVWAERDRRRLHGEAHFTLKATTTATGSGTVRSLEGELIVAVPVVGRSAEARIVPGIVGRLDREAEALNAAIRSR